MKIEMAESLFYSWLRHVKECQLVQTNWKVSPQWEPKNREKTDTFMQTADNHFQHMYGYHIFKQNASPSQILKQGECDALGVAVYDGKIQVYAVDVAFHESGLNYQGREETVAKVVAKTIRTAMCLQTYMEYSEGEIVFASPKINPAVLRDIEPCFSDINNLFSKFNLNLKARIFANEDFYNAVLQPILIASDGIADTSELFLRSYQLFHMFSHTDIPDSITKKSRINISGAFQQPEVHNNDAYNELKIGQIARQKLRKILEAGLVSPTEITKLQQADYSKATFDLQYPLLVKQGSSFETVRYYAQPLSINGEWYYLCSQWHETSANNDRPYLIRWINEHQKNID